MENLYGPSPIEDMVEVLKQDMLLRKWCEEQNKRYSLSFGGFYMVPIYRNPNNGFLLSTVLEETTPTETHPNEELLPEEKEEVDDIEKRARKPPKDGPCRGCGLDKPLNRLMLCYKCWVNKNLIDEAKARGEDFIPGIDPHPSTCGCVLPDHNGRSGDESRGQN